MSPELSAPTNVTVVGLGYIGLPLALAFAKELPTTGFDVDVARVEQLMEGKDRNNEVPESEIISSDMLLSSESSCLANADFIVVTVPTPVKEDHSPDLSPLESASMSIGVQFRKRSADLPAPIIVFESTTYPGCTEEFCGPIIERESGLKAGNGFWLGYSPERANFGDSEHTLGTIVKVVSGQTPEVATIVNETYRLVVKAGTHVVPSIKVAEASKVIENIQRDVNIALFNELAMIFDRMGIRSSDVFNAAGTKWNFHRYEPGLVGGHCIPVDPYYLTYASTRTGYDAEIVLSGREVNEAMPGFIAEKLVKMLVATNTGSHGAKILILGLAFKADIADTRNSKILELAGTLEQVGANVDVYDPNVDKHLLDNNNLNMIQNPFVTNERWDGLVLGVPHRQFDAERVLSIVHRLNKPGVVVDVTGKFEAVAGIVNGVNYWRP